MKVQRAAPLPYVYFEPFGRKGIMELLSMKHKQIKLSKTLSCLFWLWVIKSLDGASMSILDFVGCLGSFDAREVYFYFFSIYQFGFLSDIGAYHICTSCALFWLGLINNILLCL